MNLEPDHLSTYGLTYEKGALFYNQLLHGKINRVTENLELQMYEYGIDTLEDAGFEHYEISNFSRQVIVVDTMRVTGKSKVVLRSVRGHLDSLTEHGRQIIVARRLILKNYFPGILL